MRKIEVIQENDYGRSGPAVFHEWSVTYDELNDGVGTYPVAIVEWPDGQVDLVYAKLVKFSDPITPDFIDRMKQTELTIPKGAPPMETLTPMDQPPANCGDVIVCLDDGVNISAWNTTSPGWMTRSLDDDCAVIQDHPILSHCLGWRPIQKGDTFTAIDLADYEGEAVKERDSRIDDIPTDRLGIIEHKLFELIEPSFEDIAKRVAVLEEDRSTVNRLADIAAELGKTDGWVERIGANLDTAEADIDSLKTFRNFWTPIFCAISCGALILSIVAIVLSLS